MRQTNERGLNLIKEFEGFRDTAYKDVAGIITIGYGHTSDSKFPVFRGSKITEEQATVILRHDLKEAELGVIDALGDAVDTLSDNQFAACVSLAFNIGNAAFKRSSVARHIKNGDKLKAADTFRLWRKAGGRVVRGLVRRREAERTLFLREND